MKRLPLIEGFREPTLSKNSFLMLADVRGDGEGKLVIWSQEQSQIIIYKGTNRQIEKTCKLRNVSGIIKYMDQQKSVQPVIALSAENGLYIFRGLSQSFRLRIPDIFAEPQEQMIWSQFQTDPQKIASQLGKLPSKSLSETANYFLGASSNQRRLQIIKKVFSDGINQKDSISAMTVICDNEVFSVGNVVLGTQLKRLYILDTYGHSIISKKLLRFAPFILLAHGQYSTAFIIICISREGIIDIYGKSDSQPSQSIVLSCPVISAVLYFSDFVIATTDQVITHYSISNSYKTPVKINTLKVNKRINKVEMLKNKNYKCIVVGFESEFRIYSDNQLIYTHQTDFKMYSLMIGNYSREENCIILLYEKHGFEVLILHRQFNPKEKYGNNKQNTKLKFEQDSLPIPKKTPQFMSFWRDQKEDHNAYLLYQKNLRMLKWRTLKQRLKDGNAIQAAIQINSKIIGMGPTFIIKLQMENSSEKPIYQLDLLLNYQINAISIQKCENNIKMLPPFTPYFQYIHLTSLSKKNQQIIVQLAWQHSVTSTVIFIPNCEQIVD